jgi:IS4 transposase
MAHSHSVISTFLNLTQEFPDRILRLRRWSYGSVVVVLMLLTQPRRLCDYRSVLLTLKIDAPNLFVGQKTPSASSFSVARRKVPLEIMRWLLQQASTLARQAKTWRVKGRRRFYAADMSSFVVPSSKELRRRCEQPKYNTWLHAHYPQAKVLVIFDVLRRVPIDFLLLAKRVGERAGLAALYDNFRPRDVLLLDRGYPARWLLRDLIERKIDVVVRMTAKKCGSFPEVIDFLASGERSSVITMRLDKGVTATVRLLRKNFRVGRPCRHQKVESMVILTTLPAKEFDFNEIVGVYGKRWGIETLFREMKHLFNIERFHAKNLLGIQQEIAAVLIWSSLASIIQIAAERTLPPERRAMRTLCHDTASRIVIAILTGHDPGNIASVLLIEIRRHAYTPQQGRSSRRECKRPWGRWAGK